MMNITRIGRRGQVTIPSRVRRQAGLQEGDAVAFVRLGDQILITPLGKTLLELRGSIPVTQRQDFASIRRKVARRRASRTAGEDA